VKPQIVLAALVIGCVGFAAPTVAQRGKGSSSEPESTPMGIQHIAPNAGSKYEDYLFGVVKEVDQDLLVLTKTKAGADQTFKFSKKTKFIRDGKNSSFELIKVGDNVLVDADPDKKTGDLIARKVVSGVYTMQ
jgi:hypothetical protein